MTCAAPNYLTSPLHFLIYLGYFRYWHTYTSTYTARAVKKRVHVAAQARLIGESA